MKKGPWLWAAVVFLLTLVPAQVLPSARQQSPTSDEFSHHVANGYSYLVTRDFRMNPATPPLSRMLTAAPLLFLGVRAPLDHPSWQSGNSPEFARQFYYHSGGDMDTMTFWSRVPVVALSVVFGFFVFRAARRFFGDTAGLVALALYVFCPDVLAHSGLATGDLMVAFFFFFSVLRFRDYLDRPSWGNLAAAAVLTGLTFLSKFSAVLLGPLFLALLFFGKREAVSLRKGLGFVAIALLTVWAGYFFEIKPVLQNTPDPAKKAAFLREIGGPSLASAGEQAPVPLATFASSLSSMMFTRARGTNAFLLGEWSTKGWWYYYFVAFFVKNTLPFLVFSLMGLAFLPRLKIDRLTKAALCAPAAVFFLLTMPDRAQAGIRYFLPVYPFLMVLGGGAAARLWDSGRAGLRAAVVGLLAWHSAEAAMIHPHPLAYFNQLAGGPGGGYKVLRDSNIDWGQDLKGLGRLVAEKGYEDVVLFFYGPAEPSYYKIRYRRLEEDELEVPRRAVYAIGAHHIDSVRWTRKVRPSAHVGHSVYVYDLRNGLPGNA